MAKKKKNSTPALPKEALIGIARDKALSTAWSIFFTVLLDKEGYDLEGLQRVWKYCEDLSGSVAEGRVNIVDLRRVLVYEYGISLK